MQGPPESALSTKDKLTHGWIYISSKLEKETPFSFIFMLIISVLIFAIQECDYYVSVITYNVDSPHELFTKGKKEWGIFVTWQSWLLHFAWTI